jgi:hypothetical protein
LLDGTWEELHTKLSPTLNRSQPGLRERVTSSQVEVDPEILAVLHITDKSTDTRFACLQSL